VIKTLGCSRNLDVLHRQFIISILALDLKQYFLARCGVQAGVLPFYTPSFDVFRVVYFIHGNRLYLKLSLIVS
jgi:hypothetical protein